MMATEMCIEMDDRTEILDSNVWERLPEEILPQILGCLPWWSNMRLRSVSRSWKSLLSDLKFLAQSTPLPSDRAPWCILRTSIPFTIGNLNIHVWKHMVDFSATWKGFNIDVASSGLFLMRGPDPNAHFVINPLNRTNRRLPPLPKLDDQLVVAGWHYPMTMRVAEKPLNVKVVALQFGDGKLTRVFVYDMLNHSWDAVSGNVKDMNFRAVQSVLMVRNDVYLLTPSDQLYRVLGFRLVEIALPGVSHEGLVIKHIFQHRGSLMLANGTWVRDSPHPAVDLWKFDHVHETWQRVGLMPNSFAIELDRSKDLFKVDAEGDIVGFGCFHSKTLVLHNLVTSEWWSVPCRDSLQCIGFSFLWQPRLEIVL